MQKFISVYNFLIYCIYVSYEFNEIYFRRIEEIGDQRI